MSAVLAGLAEWAVRAALLGGVTALLLWVFRIGNVHVRLTVWTTVLAAILLMPLAGPWLPALSIAVPGQRARAMKAAPLRMAGDAVTHSLVGPVTTRSLAPDIAVAIWLLPALFLLGRLGLGVRLSRRLARGSRLVRDSVRESERVRVPITVGLLRPVVVLPAEWRDWDRERLRAVLEHERAHAGRRDPLRHFLASLYASVCWFHPLAWWLKAQLADLAEAASDDVALATGGDRIQYAETLLAFFEAARGRVEYQGTAMATPRTRARRIDRVLDSDRLLARPPRLVAAAAFVAGALALAFTAAAVRPVQAEVQPAPASVSKVRPAKCGGGPAYGKWLDEDVLYIATWEERKAFSALPTAEACDQFIAQFWQRRGLAFKEEYYRRIAYANRNFGWRSDRGRIYIIYGPPDQMDVFPPGETWIYRDTKSAKDLTFRFIESNGEYRLDTAGGASFSTEGLEVRVARDRSVQISIPVDTSGGAVSVYGRITNRSRRMVNSFEDTAQEVHGAYTRTTRPLDPGSYRLIVVTKRAAEVRQMELPFEIK